MQEPPQHHTQAVSPQHQQHSSQMHIKHRYIFEILRTISMMIGTTSTTDQNHISWPQFLNLLVSDSAERLEHPTEHLNNSQELINKISCVFSFFDPSTDKIVDQTSDNPSQVLYLDSRQFRQAYEILNPIMFNNPSNYHLKMLRLQVVGLLILHIITGESVSFLEAGQLKSQKVSIQQASELVKDIRAKLNRFISRHNIQEHIRVASKKHRVNYTQLLNKIFADQCKGLTQKQLIAMLTKQEEEEISEINPNAQILLFCKSEEIKKLLHKTGILKWENDKGYYVIARSDLYLTLLERLDKDTNLVIEDLLSNVIENMDPSTYQKEIQFHDSSAWNNNEQNRRINLESL